MSHGPVMKMRNTRSPLLVQVNATQAPRSRIPKGLVLLFLAAVVSLLGIYKLESLHWAAVSPAPRQSLAAEPEQLTTVKLNPKRLLLATHSRLMWYYPDTQATVVLHEGEGVHYGMFPGVGTHPSTVWTAIRPHNWRPATSQEFLVEFDMVTGKELRRVQIDARFTHEVVRVGDFVYVCDTGNGRILELEFPSMKQLRAMPLFTLKDHPNTLAPLAPDNFLVVLHNLGLSDVVRVNMTDDPPTIVGRLSGAGHKAHGLVPWREYYIMLDSDSGTLRAIRVTDPEDPAAPPFSVALWTAPEPKRFLKGLAVMDDVAYFGVSEWAPRSARDDPRSNCQLAAFDLVSNRLLWRREVPTAGLLNIVGAPHLAVGSTYTPTYSPTRQPELTIAELSTSPAVASAFNWLQTIGYPPKLSGYWSSGLPFLDNAPKWTRTPWDSGLQLPLLEVNITELANFVRELPGEVWSHEWQEHHSAVMGGRDGNMALFKPGVEAIVLLFSAGDGQGTVYKFPAYDMFASYLEPLVEEIIGAPDMSNVIRLQLALMKPNVSDIKIHVDSGGYAQRGHRIHVPLYTNSGVSFEQCPFRADPQGKQVQVCYRIPAPAGFVFELNNRVPHKVSNTGDTDRVHLVIDVTEEPHPRVELPPGSVCEYDLDKGLLCGSAAAPAAAAAAAAGVGGLGGGTYVGVAGGVAAAVDGGVAAQAAAQQMPVQ